MTVFYWRARNVRSINYYALSEKYVPCRLKGYGFLSYLITYILRQHAPSSTLIKKQIKFSSYIKKSRVEQLQSHIWGLPNIHMRKDANISPYIRRPLVILQMTLQLLHSEFTYTWGKFDFLFYQCTDICFALMTTNRVFGYNNDNAFISLPSGVMCIPVQDLMLLPLQKYITLPTKLYLFTATLPEIKQGIYFG